MIDGSNAVAIGTSITNGEIASAYQIGLWPIGNESLNANAALRSVSYVFRGLTKGAAVRLDRGPRRVRWPAGIYVAEK